MCVRYDGKEASCYPIHLDICSPIENKEPALLVSQV